MALFYLETQQVFGKQSVSPLCHPCYNGEHATSVNGTGNPTLEDMIAIGTKIKMKQDRCYEIFKEVETACGDLLHHRIK